MKFLFVILLFLLVFIPIYPKLPLLDVAFTWTYVRIEDLLVAFAYLVLGYLLWKKKVSIKNSLFWPILMFWGVGLLSTIVNIPLLENGDGYVTYKPHLVIIHYLRRIEYLGLFFVGFAAIRTRDDVKKVVYAVISSLVGVILYGLGQQYAGFPQFLTMNEEFAKGTPLPLQAGSRLSSTFGGHYDLGGYLVLVIPIVIAMGFVVKKIEHKIALGIVSFLGFFILLLTSSRVSFAALFVAVGVLIFSIMKHKKALIAVMVLGLVITAILGRDTIVDRFSKTVRVRQVTFDPASGRVLEPPTRNKDWGGLPESDSALLLPFAPVESTSSAYMVYKYKKSDYEKLLQENPHADITTINIPNVHPQETTLPGYDEIIEEVRLVEGDFQRRWALVFDISFTTRLQGSWVIAWNAFLDNPLLGKGYSTVSAASDSSYMRALGEVGILGIMSFLFILVTFLRKTIAYVAQSRDLFLKMFGLGMLSGVIGLMVNAALIDIFEASKVAFYMWMLMGITIAAIEKSGASKRVS